MSDASKCPDCGTDVPAGYNHYCTPWQKLPAVYQRLAAETARADAAEKLAERYRVALEWYASGWRCDIVVGPRPELIADGGQRARQALASVPEDVSRKGDNFDTRADGSGQHPDGFCSKCGSWSVCKCSEGER